MTSNCQRPTSTLRTYNYITFDFKLYEFLLPVSNLMTYYFLLLNAHLSLNSYFFLLPFENFFNPSAIKSNIQLSIYCLPPEGHNISLKCHLRTINSIHNDKEFEVKFHYFLPNFLLPTSNRLILTSIFLLTTYKL